LRFIARPLSKVAEPIPVSFVLGGCGYRFARLFGPEPDVGWTLDGERAAPVKRGLGSVVSAREANALSAHPTHCYPRLVASGDTDPSVRPFEDQTLDHLDALLGFARRLTGSTTLAEDLVQDTYARAFAARESFRAGTNLRAWLFRILRNVYVDQARRAQKSPFARSPLAEETVAASPQLLMGDAELDRLRNVVTRDIDAALAALSAESRLIVLLDLEGLSEREIADASGCALGTVKSRLYRARVLLRSLLGGYAP